MQKMTFREVLQTKGFKTMSLGFGIAVIGAVFAAIGLIPIAQGLVVLGILVGVIGLVMHARLFISVMMGKHKGQKDK